jgi:CheY-like chemotaxis protein
MRDYLRRLLGEYYAVEAVANGVQALEASQRQAPDLVLTDVMMPELDGVGLLRALRENPQTRAIPIMLLSARAGEEATIEGLAAGADDYLIKPFSAREVLSRVGARLEIARQRREALERAHELKTIIESVTDAVFIYSRDGHIVRTNTPAHELLGLDVLPDYDKRSRGERATLISALDEHGQPISAEQWGLSRLLRGESLIGANALDVHLRRVDGREVEVNITGAPLRDEAGAVVGAVAVARDVTERRRLERRTGEALAALLEIAEVIVGPLPVAGAPGELVARAHNERPSDTTRILVSLCCRVLACDRVAFVLLNAASEMPRDALLLGASREQEVAWRRGVQGLRLEDRFDAATCARLRAGEAVLIDTARLPGADPAPILSAHYFLLAPMLVTPPLG